MITIKLKLTNTIDIRSFQRQYNNVVRFAYNRCKEGLEKNQVIHLCKEKMNNIPDMDRSWINCAVIKASALFTSNPDQTVVFGGKKLFTTRSKKKITQDEFIEKRQIPITSIGSSQDTCGNRKFQLDIINNNKIIFKKNRHTHIDLFFHKPNKNHYKMLCELEKKCKNHEEPATISLDNNYVYISFDECVVRQEYTNFKSGRVLSLDVNPNYIGLSICDYNKSNEQIIIHREIISNKQINDMDVVGLPSTHPKCLYQTNKRKHEVFQVNKYIIKLAKQFHCEYITYEKLDVVTKDHQKGKNYNRLVNKMWNRSRMLQNLAKQCNIAGIKHEEVLTQYSSFIGCINHPTEIDSIAASLEINRRSRQFIGIYRTKQIKLGNKIVFPNMDKKEILNRWKEEGLTAKDLSDWKTLYSWVKIRELSWRVLFSIDKVESSFRLYSLKSLIKKYILV